MLWNGGDAQVLLTGREVLQRRGCCWDSVWLFFMYCDRPHSFRSIFIQSSRLTMDPRLIYFITPLRLCVCSSLCAFKIYISTAAQILATVCVRVSVPLLCVSDHWQEKAERTAPLPDSCCPSFPVLLQQRIVLPKQLMMPNWLYQIWLVKNCLPLL